MAGAERMKATASAISSGVVPWPSGTDWRSLLEVFLALMDAFQRGSRADGVHADKRRERLRHCFRRGAERGFAHRIGEKQRIGPKHALIDDVDDVSRFVRGQLRGESLGQEDGRRQIDGEVGAPARLRDRLRAVVAEIGGVIDEAGDVAEACARLGEQALNLRVFARST